VEEHTTRGVSVCLLMSERGLCHFFENKSEWLSGKMRQGNMKTRERRRGRRGRRRRREQKSL